VCKKKMYLKKYTFSIQFVVRIQNIYFEYISLYVYNTRTVLFTVLFVFTGVCRFAGTRMETKFDQRHTDLKKISNEFYSNIFSYRVRCYGHQKQFVIELFPPLSQLDKQITQIVRVQCVCAQISLGVVVTSVETRLILQCSTLYSPTQHVPLRYRPV